MVKIIKDFSIEVDEQEILRLLGHTSKSKEIKEGTKKVVAEMIELSAALVIPEGIYSIREAKGLPVECLLSQQKKSLFVSAPSVIS